MNHIIEPNEKILLKVNHNKDEPSLYVIESKGKLIVSGTWTCDYPIHYGKGTIGWDGTFFDSQLWVKHQDTIIDTCKAWYLKHEPVVEQYISGRWVTRE